MSSTSTTWTTDTNTKSGTVQIYDSSVSTLRITAGESTDAILELFADEGDDNADKWRLWVNDADDDLHFANYTSGSWVDKLTIQDGGNVGIGTSTPTVPSSHGSAVPFVEISGTQPILALTDTSSGKEFLLVSQESEFYIYDEAATATRLLIDTNGRVGIGTTSPDVLLDVESTVGSNPTVAVFGDTSHNTGVFIMSQANNVNIQACAKNSHGTTTKLCLNPNGGNVGVGTDTPDTTLHISHPTTTIDYYENKGLLISEAGSADGIVMWSRTDSECYIGMNKDLSSGTGSLALGMNLDSNSNKQLALWIRESGRVGIGTSAPQYLMDVKIADGSNNLYTARFENADATDPNGIIIDHSGVDLSSDDTGDHEYLKCEDSNNTVFAVYGDGDLVNEDNSYTSDVRIKQDITDATSKLDDINKLKVRNYRYKDSNGEHLSGKLGEKRLGFIADELETVFPGLIRKKKVEKFGTAFSDLKCITWTPLVAVLVKAVQELSAKVTALENA